jgi:hypothetical protein
MTTVSHSNHREFISLDRTAIGILIMCFEDGLTEWQACREANINHEIYKRRLDEDAEFARMMLRAQQTLSIKARRLVAEAIKRGDVSTAKWWLDKEQIQKTDHLLI